MAGLRRSLYTRGRLARLAEEMESAVTRLIASMGYRVILHEVIDGLEVDLYGVRVRGGRARGVIVEMKMFYRDSLREQVERRRHLAHRVYAALPDWSIAEALARLPDWVGLITFDPVTGRAEVVRKAMPGYSILADLVARAMLEKLYGPRT